MTQTTTLEPTAKTTQTSDFFQPFVFAAIFCE